MLVLKRKVGQTIVVPQYDIAFTVLEVNGNGVRVGIAAPTDVAVHRQEFWHRIRDEAATPVTVVAGGVEGGAG